MEMKEQTITISEICYLIFIAIMTLAKGMGLYDGMALYNISLVLGAFFFALKLCLTKQSVYEWIWSLGLLGLGMLIYYNSGQTGAIIYLAVIVGMKGVNLNRALGLSLFIWGTTFVIQVLSCLLGFKTDIFMVHEKLGLGHIIRWSLGAPHPNVLQITAMMLCGLILYFTKAEGKKLIKIVSLMVLFNLYIFMYSVSYTGIITVMFYLFVHTYLCMRKRLSVIEKTVVYMAFPACAAFSIVGPLIYPSKFWGLCNKVFNTRFFLSMNYMKNDPITLFGGRPSDRIDLALRNLDCSYVYVLMHYGIVLLALMVFGYMLYIHYCMKNEKYKEIAIVLGMAVAAIAEPFFVNSSFKNITVFFIGAYLYSCLERVVEKKQKSILFKEFCLFGIGNRSININFSKLECLWKNLYSNFSQNRKRITISSLSIAVVAAVLFAVYVDMPTTYYVKRSSAQMQEAGNEKKWIYLDVNNLPEDFEGKILNYGDATTPMQRFEGNISKVEYVRGIISTGIWCGLGCAVVISVIIVVKNNDRKQRI